MAQMLVYAAKGVRRPSKLVINMLEKVQLQ